MFLFGVYQLSVMNLFEHLVSKSNCHSVNWIFFRLIGFRFVNPHYSIMQTLRMTEIIPIKPWNSHNPILPQYSFMNDIKYETHWTEANKRFKWFASAFYRTHVFRIFRLGKHTGTGLLVSYKTNISLSFIWKMLRKIKFFHFLLVIE